MKDPLGMSFPMPPLPRPIEFPNHIAELNSQIARTARTNSASAFVEHISAQVRQFEKTLDAASEVGAFLASFGQAMTVHVQEIMAVDPSLIVIVGTSETGDPISVIQHVSQISFLLAKVPRVNPDEERRPIGFTVKSEP